MALNDKQLELKLCPIGFALLENENPVEASRGGSNVVFHYCDELDVRASYAGCLHTLEAIADGRGHLRPECEAAYIAGRCPAVAMRKMELRADRALFYVSYKQLTERRAAMWADQEPVVKYGRKKDRETFVPTAVEPSDDIEVAAPQMEVEAPKEIKTNIMEQVLKKKVENDRRNQ